LFTPAGDLDFTGGQMVLTLKLISMAMCFQDANSKKPEVRRKDSMLRLLKICYMSLTTHVPAHGSCFIRTGSQHPEMYKSGMHVFCFVTETLLLLCHVLA
jgi:hypothetical protein